jgi:TolB-like protein
MFRVLEYCGSKPCGGDRLRYRFDNYTLDIGRGELRRGTVAIRTARQVFDLLEYLIRNRERLVSKDDLIAAVWNGRAISDSALTTRLNAVRHAIGDSGNEQRLIKTFPRKGFRFVAAVTEEDGSASVPGWDAAVAPPKSGPLLPGNPSIAVLSFTPHSDDLDEESFAEGIAEDVLTKLAGLRWLFVAQRNASFAYAPKRADVRQISRDLGVRYVLEGRVRRVGSSRAHITGRLVAATAGAGIYIWVGRFDRHVADIPTVHDEIAAAVAGAIVDAERRHALRKRHEDLDAWEAYQCGMWHMSRCEPAENELAQTFFQRAIEIDPTYAPSHGALGWSYMMAASIYSQMSIAEGCALGEPLVRKATALDDNDLAARARLAIADLLRGDLEGAFESAEEVLSVDPTCAEALGVKGTALLYSGRRGEGRAAISQHLKLSPRDPARPIRLSQIAASLYLDENYEAAAMTARQVIRQYRKHPTAYRWLAASLGQLGRTAEAEETLETLRTNAPSSFDMYISRRPQYCSIEYAPMVAGLRKAGWNG